MSPEIIRSIAWSITLRGGDVPLGRVVTSTLAASLGEVESDVGEDAVQEVLQRRSPEVVGPVVGHDLDRGHEVGRRRLRMPTY